MVAAPAMIADTVRAELARRHKTQQWLAEQLGISRDALRLRLKEPRRWKPAELHYLAELFNLTSDELQGNNHR